MNFWVMLYRFAWVVLIVLCLIALTCIFLPKGQEYQALQTKKARMEEENRRLEASIRSLQVQQERLDKDKAFVERTARELGMAKPGETVYKITPDGSRPAASRSGP